jgi:hypothetical protein
MVLTDFVRAKELDDEIRVAWVRTPPPHGWLPHMSWRRDDGKERDARTDGVVLPTL